MTINERIKLNGEEYRDLLKSYLGYIHEGLNANHFSLKEIKVLFDKLKCFKKEIAVENEYLDRLLRIEYRVNEEDMARVLEMIDRLNRETYEYYEDIGDNYPYPESRIRILGTERRSTPCLSENYKIQDEIKGLTLSMNDIKDYFLGSEALNYAMSFIKVLDAGEDNYFYGASVIEEDGLIRRVRMIVPPIHNLETALINVHLTRHVMDLFDYIGKKYPDNNDFEQRARDEEKKFITEYVRNK